MLAWPDNLLRDIHFATRQIVKNPGFAAAILTLPIGIGASTSIFSVADAVLLRITPNEPFIWVSHNIDAKNLS
jgi:hypothetical protein